MIQAKNIARELSDVSSNFQTDMKMEVSEESTKNRSVIIYGIQRYVYFFICTHFSQN